MLAARRDPILDHGPHDAHSSPQGSPPAGYAGGHATRRTTGFARLIGGLQILGTVLAVPLGLASGYSIYRANFSPEANCGSLRANIISMLDKNADAATLRLLVRSDVAKFEQSCGAVDPDAVAAFKTLLAKPRAVAAAKEMRPAAATHAAPARHVARVRPDGAKRVATRTKVEPAPVHRKSDADWLAAVRRALVARSPVVPAQAAEAPVAPAPTPAVQPMGKPIPAQIQAAPPLPPATAVADAPAPHPDDDHPVPPASIPNVGPGPAR